MIIHTLQRTQVVHAPLDECWSFFSNPRNLARITPPSLDFQVLSDVPEEVYAGLMIEYRVRPLLGIQTSWLTEITHVDGRRRFVDEQRVGPYRIWHHEHHFRELGRKHTEMRDTVHYVLPFSPFSEIVHPWLVKRQLEQIFEYREKETRQLFSESPTNGAASVSAGR